MSSGKLDHRENTCNQIKGSIEKYEDKVAVYHIFFIKVISNNLFFKKTCHHEAQ